MEIPWVTTNCGLDTMPSPGIAVCRSSAVDPYVCPSRCTAAYPINNVEVPLPASDDRIHIFVPGDVHACARHAYIDRRSPR